MARQRTGRLFTYSVVVVDNDAVGSARGTVSQAQQSLGLEVQYEIESERTIPAARNRALGLATGNLVAIIDDDEFAPPDWLLRMYEAVRFFEVDGALGAVRPFYDEKPPGWLVASGICDLPVYPTGALLHWSETKTGNVLLKKSVFDDYGLSFDPRFRTGGSDQDFFRRAMERGCRFVAVAEAAVYEVVPRSRWTRNYWIRRAMVNGFNAKRYASATMSPGRQVLLTLKSAVGAAACAAALPVAACLGQHRLLLCLEKGSYHLSRLCASFGIELWNRRDF